MSRRSTLAMLAAILAGVAAALLAMAKVIDRPDRPGPDKMTETPA